MSEEQPRATRTFRAARVRYDPARAERQGRVTRLAIERLGASAALPFLNADHADLGARPLDLAGESAESCARVEALIAALDPAAAAA
ncbi:hypothetical protein ASE95_11960 [Sphingomonas sp. Leaf231]|uniref:hypothetical protein n=1 Tax=Sphingomonas sp. Leaf231 TaxID=1736301 RepID=UPI0007022A62|nr:hypothetical protein [Sphingomonas sp. Leaf231]KQN90978.1 hypothetical protein ASE95_11960 [Sphingomonas sp. Leaf231]